MTSSISKRSIPLWNAAYARPQAPIKKNKGARATDKDFTLPLYFAVHDPLSSQCLPPFQVVLEDADVADLMRMAFAPEDSRVLHYKDLVKNYPFDFQADGFPRDDRPNRGRPSVCPSEEGRQVYGALYGNLYIFRGGAEFAALYDEARGRSFSQGQQRPWLNYKGSEFDSMTKCQEAFLETRKDTTRSISVIEPSTFYANLSIAQYLRCQRLGARWAEREATTTPGVAARNAFQGQFLLATAPMQAGMGYIGKRFKEESAAELEDLWNDMAEYCWKGNCPWAFDRSHRPPRPPLPHQGQHAT